MCSHVLYNGGCYAMDLLWIMDSVKMLNSCVGWMKRDCRPDLVLRIFILVHLVLYSFLYSSSFYSLTQIKHAGIKSEAVRVLALKTRPFRFSTALSEWRPLKLYCWALSLVPEGRSREGGVKRKRGQRWGSGYLMRRGPVKERLRVFSCPF